MMKINLYFYTLVIFSLFKLDICALSQVPVPNKQTKLKYDTITESFLNKQINDYYLKNIATIKLITTGFNEKFKFLDNNLYQYIDLFITTKEVAQQRDKIFSNIDELITNYTKLYKQYLEPAANEAHIAHGKTIKDLDETDIQLRKEKLEEFSAEINSYNTKLRSMFREVEKNLNNLKQLAEPASVLRYKESINVVVVLNSLFEKIINKVYGTVERLTSNGVSR